MNTKESKSEKKWI